MPMNTIWTGSEAESDRVLAIPFVQEFVRLCDDGFRMRFHERNGGNLSYWLSREEAAMLPVQATVSSWVSMEDTVAELAGEYFLITASGSCFRNIAHDPRKNLCIIRLDETGSKWRLIWGLREGGRPTSELESHLMNFAIRSRDPERMCKVMYHAHPEKVIALSCLLPQDSKIVTRALWSAMIECAFIFPYGVGVVPCMVPGGARISGRTAELMEKHDAVLWAHHGLFCSGQDLDSAFGLMETVDKAAGVCLRLLSSRQERLYTIPDEIFLEISRALGGKMNMDYIYGDSDDRTEE